MSKSKYVNVRITNGIDEILLDYAERRDLYYGDELSRGAAARELIRLGAAVVKAQHGTADAGGGSNDDS
jgi:hypothetical protein